MIRVAFLIKAEPGLFSPIRMDSKVYDAIFKTTADKLGSCLGRVTPRLLKTIVKGTRVFLVGVKNKVSLSVEVRAIDAVAKKATVCVVFPFLGNEKEQGKVLEAIKFQVSAVGFKVNHCGLETEVSIGVDVEEVHQNVGNGSAQRYYKIKK